MNLLITGKFFPIDSINVSRTPDTIHHFILPLTEKAPSKNRKKATAPK